MYGNRPINVYVIFHVHDPFDRVRVTHNNGHFERNVNLEWVEGKKKIYFLFFKNRNGANSNFSNKLVQPIDMNYKDMDIVHVNLGHVMNCPIFPIMQPRNYYYKFH